MKKHMHLFLLILGLALYVGCTTETDQQPGKTRLAQTQMLNRHVLSQNILVSDIHRMYLRSMQASGHIRADALPSRSLVSVPLLFAENVGQTHKTVQYVLRQLQYVLFFGRSEITAVVGFPRRPQNDSGQSERQPPASSVIRMSMVDAASVKPVGEIKSKALVNHLIGADKGRHYKNIPTYRNIRYPGIYRGVDMVFYGLNGQPHYGFHLEDSASVETIGIKFKGAQKLYVDKKGHLVIETANGRILHRKPRMYELGETKKRLEGTFVVRRSQEVGFRLIDKRTPGKALFIDPEIDFVTYYGGTFIDGVESSAGAVSRKSGLDMDVANETQVYLVGNTLSADFPTTDAAEHLGGSDIFVMGIDMSSDLLDPQVVYATFLGSEAQDHGTGVSALEDGDVYVSGTTMSWDFPIDIESPPSTDPEGGGFVVKLGPNGDLDYGTFLLGQHSRYIPNAVVHQTSSFKFGSGVYVAGSVLAGEGDRKPDWTGLDLDDFEIDSAFQATHGGGNYDGFVAKLNNRLDDLVYFTYLGGSFDDAILDLDVVDGEAYVTGSTASPDFPYTPDAAQDTLGDNNAFSESCSDDTTALCNDAFVAHLNAAGSDLAYGSFYGKDDSEWGRGIAVDADDRIAITGGMSNPTDDDHIYKSFVIRTSQDRSEWETEERIRGLELDFGNAIALDAAGGIHATGVTRYDGEGMGADAGQLNGESDMFYTFLDSEGEQSLFTYLGGNREDAGHAIASARINGRDCVYLAGTSSSTDIETTDNAFQDHLATPEDPDPNDSLEPDLKPDLLLYVLCVEGFDPSDLAANGDIDKRGRDTVEPGETFDFIISIDNQTDLAGNVDIFDEVPPAFTVTDVSESSPNEGRCDFNGNIVECANFTLPANAPQVVRIPVTVNEMCGQFTNTATLSPPGGSNNTDCFEFGSVATEIPDTDCIDVSHTVSIDCTNLPPDPFCGDGRIDADLGEACDDGALNGTADSDCSSDCRIEPRCGPDNFRCGENQSCEEVAIFYDECDIIFPLSIFVCGSPIGSGAVLTRYDCVDN